MIVELNEKNFNEKIENGLKLVEFYTNWCNFCRKQDEVFKELPNMWVGKINATQNPKLTNDFDIKGFPSFVLFKNGKILTEFSGYHNKNDLIMRLVEFIKYDY
ncbi:MAG: thioredoxin [Cyanobacteria bacterium SIG30]|nr:thioredoxin [Cyanobacteria bacterium SIG30]